MTTLESVIDFIGTFAFAISGLKHAAAKQFDWFGGFVCAFAVAIGGGTIRDVLIGTTPVWMLDPTYVICTFLALVTVVVFSSWIDKLDNAWFIFDTFGLALFTISGLQKTLSFGFPIWVAIAMGCITGSAGGVIRDVLLNNEPVIFRKEIYAMASIAGGLLFWMLGYFGVISEVNATITFLFICIVRFLAVRYHISLPHFKMHQ